MVIIQAVSLQLFISFSVCFVGHSDVSNQVLLREILYAFQGIQGQVFQWDATHENLQLKPTVGFILLRPFF